VSHWQARRTCTGFCSPRPLASGPVAPWRRRALPLQRALNRHLEPRRPGRRALPHQLRPCRGHPLQLARRRRPRDFCPLRHRALPRPRHRGCRADASARYGLARSPSGARFQPASHSLRWCYRLGPADRKKPNHRALCRLREALGQPHSHEQDGGSRTCRRIENRLQNLRVENMDLDVSGPSPVAPENRPAAARCWPPLAFSPAGRSRLGRSRLGQSRLGRSRSPGAERRAPSAAVVQAKSAEGPARQSGQEGAAMSA
jgi:hypothetical protein